MEQAPKTQITLVDVRRLTSLREQVQVLADKLGYEIRVFQATEEVRRQPTVTIDLMQVDGPVILQHDADPLDDTPHP